MLYHIDIKMVALFLKNGNWFLAGSCCLRWLVNLVKDVAGKKQVIPFKSVKFLLEHDSWVIYGPRVLIWLTTVASGNLVKIGLEKPG